LLVPTPELEGFHGDGPIGGLRAIFAELREIRTIPGAGHMVQLAASDAVNGVLVEYLGDIRCRWR